MKVIGVIQVKGGAGRSCLKAQVNWQVGVVCVLLGLTGATASAKTERKASEVLAFKRHNPCPSTGERGGKCPGYVVDHIQPLCAGGADNHQTNMQ